ncbi:MAG: hypothetical protein WC292_03195 [Clostridia bacterium]
MAKDKKNNEIYRVWDAFLISGRPGYYMLYKALKDGEKEDK